MSSGIYYTFDELCSAYNESFKKEDYEAVKTLAPRILEIAKAQVSNPHTAPEMRSKFQRWIDSVQNTLIDIQSGNIQKNKLKE